jgi:hypothetical protein
MASISLDQIPIDMKTILNNTLSQMKKKKQLETYMVKYEDIVVSLNYPQSRKSCCEVTISSTNTTQPLYRLKMTSEEFSKKSEAERQVAYMCYHQVMYDFKEELHNDYASSGEDSYFSDEAESLSSSLIACPDCPVENITEEIKSDKKVTKDQSIYSLLPVVLPNHNYSFSIYILADIENKPNTAKLEKYIEQFTNVILLKFVGVNHPNRSKGNIIVKSSYKDAADHAITMYVGGIIQAVPISVDIIIYTGDRFGSAVQEFCDFETAHVYHMAHIEDIQEHIGQYKYINSGKLKELILP